MSMTAHYMTVTGFIRDDNVEHENSVIVSSNGKCYIMDFDDYYDNNKEIILNGFGSGIGSCIYEILN